MAIGKNTYKEPHAVEYRVAWDQVNARFSVYRETALTGSFSPQHGIAVGLAVREAHQEASKSGKKVIVSSWRDGKRVMEWDGVTLAWPSGIPVGH